MFTSLFVFVVPLTVLNILTKTVVLMFTTVVSNYTVKKFGKIFLTICVWKFRREVPSNKYQDRKLWKGLSAQFLAKFPSLF
jgi:hypothetical protein